MKRLKMRSWLKSWSVIGNVGTIQSSFKNVLRDTCSKQVLEVPMSSFFKANAPRLPTAMAWPYMVCIFMAILRAFWWCCADTTTSPSDTMMYFRIERKLFHSIQIEYSHGSKNIWYHLPSRSISQDLSVQQNARLNQDLSVNAVYDT